MIASSAQTAPQAPFKRNFTVSRASWALVTALLAAPPRENPQLRALLRHSGRSFDKPPTELAPGTDINHFSCGADILDTALRRHAETAATNGDPARTRCFVGLIGGRVAGFFALRPTFMHRVLADSSDPDPAIAPLPFVLLVQLGVDRPRQGQGLGTELLASALRHGISFGETFEARGFCVHALSNDVKPFYLQRGFHPVPATIDPLGIIVTFEETARALEG